MSESFQRRVRDQLAALDRLDLARTCPPIRDRVGLRYRLQDRLVVGFCSNDYLGLADHPDLPGHDALAPPGAGASRLVSGDLPVHRALEEVLAHWTGCEDAVLFPSGYQANLGVLPTLLAPTDLVHSDALNHASLVDGLRLARAPRLVTPHLARPPLDVQDPARTWWVLESVFSMDGDSPTPSDLAAHLGAGGCLYLDEAHAFGLHEPGPGFAGQHALRPTVLIGTLGKALGCAGAFAGGSAAVCTLLRTRCRSFVYTTAPSPRAAATALAAVALVRGPRGTELRARLRRNLARLATALDLPRPLAPILPFILRDNHRALAVAADLLARGFHVQPIRPPTVPEGTARLRVTVSAAHSDEDLDGFAAALTESLRVHELHPAAAFRSPAPVTRP